MAMYKLAKCARLSGVCDTTALFERGQHYGRGAVRCTFLVDQPQQRVLVSAPKRLFKRAVDRNLLKRRMREAYRLHRGLLGGAKIHLALRYSSGVIKPYKDIEDEVSHLLEHLSKFIGDIEQVSAVGVDSHSVVDC